MYRLSVSSIFALTFVVLACPALAGDLDGGKPPAGSPERGLKFLLNRPYLRSFFTAEEFDALPAVWSDNWRKMAEAAGVWHGLACTHAWPCSIDRFGFAPRRFETCGV